MGDVGVGSDVGEGDTAGPDGVGAALSTVEVGVGSVDGVGAGVEEAFGSGRATT